MKIVCISDTHNQHNKLNLPKGDMIIHCGDETHHNYFAPNYWELLRFLDWFEGLDFKYKLFIPGNHSIALYSMNRREKEKIFDRGITYLEDGVTNINGVTIAGFPCVRNLPNWAFHLKDKYASDYWSMVPINTDILVTHGPAYDILDKVPDGNGGFYKTGDKELLNRISFIKPKFHLHGHIHEGYGKAEHDGVTHINCSVLDENYTLKNNPVVIEI